MTTTTPRRGGFTLIELLVVISIISIISAIAVGGFFRVRNAQTFKACEGQVANRNTAFNRLWTAARDQADKEFKEDTNGVASTLTGYCGGDRDRARSVWLYAKLKAEFPQTFWQAARPVILFDNTTPTAQVVLIVPARRVFASNPTIKAAATPTTAPTLTADEAFNQSAALLYLILTEKGARGEVDDATGITVGSVTAGGEPMQVYMDVYGTPLGYIRWATNGDLQDPNNGFSKKGAANPDPFDPTGRLNKPSPTYQPWNPSSDQKLACAKSLFGPSPTGPLTGPYTASTAAFTFPSKAWQVHWQPTIISMGKDHVVATTFGTVDAPTGLAVVGDDGDEVLGYKLRRENSGN